MWLIEKSVRKRKKHIMWFARVIRCHEYLVDQKRIIDMKTKPGCSLTSIIFYTFPRSSVYNERALFNKVQNAYHAFFSFSFALLKEKFTATYFSYILFTSANRLLCASRSILVSRWHWGPKAHSFRKRVLVSKIISRFKGKRVYR